MNFHDCRATPQPPRPSARHEEPRSSHQPGLCFYGLAYHSGITAAYHSGITAAAVPVCDRPIQRLPPTSPLSRCPEPYWQEMWDIRQIAMRRCPQAGTHRAPFILAHRPGRLYGTAMFVPGAKIPLPLGLLTPLPAQPIPEASQRVGMGPRNQERRLQ
jgi:hypothetical protein